MKKTHSGNSDDYKGDDPKYIAQAGVLRSEPSGIVGRCAVFRYGPGLKSY